MLDSKTLKEMLQIALEGPNEEVNEIVYDIIPL